MPLSAAFSCACLGLFALVGARGSPVYRIFALGMLLLALEQILSFSEIRSDSTAGFRRADFWKMLVEGLDYCVWLAFSICFAREDWKRAIARWRWVILAAGVLPPTIISFFYGWLFIEIDPKRKWSILFGQPAFIYYIITLLIAILILVNIEETLRSSSGATRWRIKFMLMGVGFLFAARIYCTVERVLSGGDSFRFSAIESGSLLIADFLIIISILRSKLQNITIHISQDLLLNSTAVVIAGVYLLALCIVVKIASFFGIGDILFHNAFVILIAVVGVLALFLSGGVQHWIKRFVTEHFNRPFHDYKKIWETLTKRTVSLVDLKDLCTVVAKIIAETFGVSAVSVWLYDDNKRPVLSGSTHLSPPQQTGTKIESEIELLMLSMQNEQEPVKLAPSGPAPWESTGLETGQPDFQERVYCCTPLVAGGVFLGIITAGSKLHGEEFTFEDLALLKTIADQTASFILNRKLFEDLGEVREMEAFQNLSAFFVHDLKNLSSTLALTFQNLPVHFDNPEYRKDAVKVIGGSVDKIKEMCVRLSAFNQKHDLNLVRTDLSAIVLSAISDFDNCADMVIQRDLGDIPPVRLDPDKIRGVLINLILNAREACGRYCLIKVSTSLENGCVVVSVRDNGCGIAREFLDKSLFKPFKSTKTGGLGIGLFHGRMIVQAHHGRIEVESELGKGSEFRVLLPAEVDNE